MAAYTDTRTTEQFADLLTDAMDATDRDVTVNDGNEGGFLVPAGETLLVTDHESGATYLLTVQKVD